MGGGQLIIREGRENDWQGRDQGVFGLPWAAANDGAMPSCLDFLQGGE
jgi:hypothetical protein